MKSFSSEFSSVSSFFFHVCVRCSLCRFRIEFTYVFSLRHERHGARELGIKQTNIYSNGNRFVSIISENIDENYAFLCGGNKNFSIFLYVNMKIECDKIIFKLGKCHKTQTSNQILFLRIVVNGK